MLNKEPFSARALYKDFGGDWYIYEERCSDSRITLITFYYRSAYTYTINLGMFEPVLYLPFKWRSYDIKTISYDEYRRRRDNEQ